MHVNRDRLFRALSEREAVRLILPLNGFQELLLSKFRTVDVKQEVSEQRDSPPED